MVEENDHSACVNAWLKRGATSLSPGRLVDAFEAAFSAVWQRAHQTLGDVTLMAIVDRVLYVVAEQYPTFAALELEATGLRCDELRRRAGELQADHLTEGVRFVLVEFLTVLGNLTDDILSPALHAELSKVMPDADRDLDRKDGQGAKS